MTDRSAKTESSPARYFCPGEPHPISPSVHYARLAAFYPKCHRCPLRHHAGHLPPDASLRLREPDQRGDSLVTANGIRGVYLNDINRFHAAALANAYLTLLVQEVFQAPAAEQPTLVVGYQEHPAAPDLMIGVVNALRATGVTIVDLGLTVAPELSFAIQQLDATGGILITGAGGNPSWIGLDFLLADGRAIVAEDQLAQIEAARELPILRIANAQGSYRTWNAADEYESSLTNLFHALRPLRLGFAAPLNRIHQRLDRLFAALPCTLDVLALPHRRRALQSPDDTDILKLGQHVLDRGLHLGILIDDDGRSCAIVNDRGQLVPRELWQQWLTEGDAIETMAHTQHNFSFDQDAIITLAFIMSEMSRSDAQLSERLWIE